MSGCEAGEIAIARAAAVSNNRPSVFSSTPGGSVNVESTDEGPPPTVGRAATDDDGAEADVDPVVDVFGAAEPAGPVLDVLLLLLAAAAAPVPVEEDLGPAEEDAAAAAAVEAGVVAAAAVAAAAAAAAAEAADAAAAEADCAAAVVAACNCWTSFAASCEIRACDNLAATS